VIDMLKGIVCISLILLIGICLMWIGYYCIQTIAVSPLNPKTVEIVLAYTIVFVIAVIFLLGLLAIMVSLDD
jgi:hypothetical protein